MKRYDCREKPKGSASRKTNNGDAPTLRLPTHELNNAPMRLPADIAAKKNPYDFTPPKESAKEGSMAIVIPIEKLATTEPIKNTLINERKTIEKPSFKSEKYCLVESDVFAAVCCGIFNEKNKRAVIANVKESITYKEIAPSSATNIPERVVQIKSMP